MGSTCTFLNESRRGNENEISLSSDCGRQLIRSENGNAQSPENTHKRDRYDIILLQHGSSS